MKKTFSFFLAALMLFSVLTGCGAKETSSEPDEITQLELTAVTRQITLEIPKVNTGCISVDSKNFTKDDVVFVSTDESIATVDFGGIDEDGIHYVIYSHAPGTATVYAQNQDGTIKSDEIVVNVVAAQPSDTDETVQ